MRLITIGGIAALAAAAVLAACSDQPNGGSPTGPLARTALAEGSRIHAQGTGTLSLMTASGLRSHAMGPWSADASVRGGVGRDEGRASPLGVLAITSAMRAEVSPSGGIRRSDFTDARGVVHTLVALYGPDGGPPRALQVYEAGKLVVSSTLEWTSANGGWVMRSATHRVYRDEVLVAELNGTASTPPQVARAGLAPDALRQVAAGAVRLFGPREVAAQSFTTCFKENLEVIALAATLAGLLATAEALPVLTPVVEAAIVATTAKLIQAEMAFWLCMQNHSGPIFPGGKPILPPLDCPSGGDILTCGLTSVQ